MKPKHHGTPISFEGVFRKMAKQRQSKDELCDMGLRSLVHPRPAEIERYEDGCECGHPEAEHVASIMDDDLVLLCDLCCQAGLPQPCEKGGKLARHQDHPGLFVLRHRRIQSDFSRIEESEETVTKYAECGATFTKPHGKLSTKL